jgi:hypothetical protein
MTSVTGLSYIYLLANDSLSVAEIIRSMPYPRNLQGMGVTTEQDSCSSSRTSYDYSKGYRRHLEHNDI